MRTLWPRTTRWFTRSLGARLVALFLGLLAVVQIASFGAIKSSLRAQAYRELPDALAVADRVLLSQLDELAAKNAERVRLFGGDFGFHTVVREDAETIRSVLEENATGRTGADEAALLGVDFVLRAQSGTHIGALAPGARALAALAERDGSASELLMLDGAPHMAVLAPVKPVNGALLGWVLMSFRLENRLVDDMRYLSKLHFTLLARESAGAPWRAALSSLAPERARALAQDVRADDAGSMQSLQVQGEELGVRARWLAGAPDGAPGTRPSGAILAVVSASIDEATQVSRDLQLSLLAITVGGFAAFALGSLYTARRVTTPLRSLIHAADRLGAGDYGTPMHGLKREDELGQLAQSFETMRVSVSDKQQQILQLAYWDTLTGLPNRAQFRETASAALAGGQQVAVIMLDLDRFKHVNDVLGYRFGDLLLKGVAQRLTQQLTRDGDLVARLSGDEFAVLLRDADTVVAEVVAQRIAHAFDRPLTLEEHKVDIGASLGVACAPLHADEVDALLSRAEVAMYAAKRRGSGALTYDASIDAGSAQTLSLLSELRDAIAHGELRLFLQPKLALETGSVVGAEALVRWHHPTRGLVPPMQFIPFAEQTGFIRVLTMWVFEEAARLWLELHAGGVELKLSVNLSTRDLLDQALPGKFDALLIKHRVPAEAFCLEITESAIMDDPQRALATLNRLSAMGFGLSIDDFGTGYSSLAYLKRLPVDELKIDKSFVMNMETDQDDAKIVRSTIDLAHNLGLSVVAEGVESAKVWDLLRELNCDQAQGYHMGKPMPSADFRQWSVGWVEKRRTAAANLARPVLH
jgi:diguanylate cyclase (GGDEF)-like protein